MTNRREILSISGNRRFAAPGVPPGAAGSGEDGRHPHHQGGVRHGGPGARGAGVPGHPRRRRPVGRIGVVTRVLDEVGASVKEALCFPT
jgi:hypothetical protein